MKRFLGWLILMVSALATAGAARLEKTPLLPIVSFRALIQDLDLARGCKRLAIETGSGFIWKGFRHHPVLAGLKGPADHAAIVGSSPRSTLGALPAEQLLILNGLPRLSERHGAILARQNGPRNASAAPSVERAALYIGSQTKGVRA